MPLAPRIGIFIFIEAGTLRLAEAEITIRFENQILPILEQNCFECHSTQKQKGHLRLDSREFMLKGGDSGAALVAGKAGDSLLTKRVSLPRDDDEAMPPKGAGLTASEKALLENWINEGADWLAGFAVQASPRDFDISHGMPVTPEEQNAIDQLGKLGIAVRPLSKDVHWHGANFRAIGTRIPSDALALLLTITRLGASARYRKSSLPVSRPLTAGPASGANADGYRRSRPFSTRSSNNSRLPSWIANDPPNESIAAATAHEKKGR